MVIDRITVSAYCEENVTVIMLGHSYHVGTLLSNTLPISLIDYSNFKGN